jgi:hypothetical protein
MAKDTMMKTVATPRYLTLLIGTYTYIIHHVAAHKTTLPTIRPARDLTSFHFLDRFHSLGLRQRVNGQVQAPAVRTLVPKMGCVYSGLSRRGSTTAGHADSPCGKDEKYLDTHSNISGWEARRTVVPSKIGFVGPSARRSCQRGSSKSAEVWSASQKRIRCQIRARTRIRRVSEVRTLFIENCVPWVFHVRFGKRSQVWPVLNILFLDIYLVQPLSRRAFVIRLLSTLQV